MAAGTTVMLCPIVSQRDHRHWDRADSFDPTRWATGSDATAHAGAQGAEPARSARGSFIPFSLGARSCVGQGVAQVELKIMLSELVRAFVWQVPEGREHDTLIAVSTVSLMPKRNIELLISKR